MREIDIETTEKANYLISIMSKKWLCQKVGFTVHTLYTRLIEHNWKQSERMTINHYYDKSKKAISTTEGGSNEAKG
jgi:hypothetical protein